MDNTYELWLFITLVAIFAVGIVAMVLEGKREWKHLENCSKTRKSMARMIENE